MSQHGARIFATWVKTILAAGGLAVEIGVKPAGTPTKWAVIWPIAGGVVDGTLENPIEDATPDLQVTSVAYYQEQTLWMVDKVRTLLDAAVPATLPDGRHVTFMYPTFAQPSFIHDIDVAPPVWYSPDRFSFGTTP